MNSDIPKVFISSVCQEFLNERPFLAAMLKSCGYNPIYSESPDFTLFSRLSPAENCLANVGKSHIFLLILGEEYGTKGGNDVSVVEQEYQTARERNLHIIVCIAESAWTKFWQWKTNAPESYSDSQVEQFKFIERIRTQHYAFPFSDMMDLCDRVRDKIANIFSELLENSISEAKESLATNDTGETINVDINTGGSLLSYFIDCLEQEYKNLTPLAIRLKYKREKHWHRKCDNVFEFESVTAPVWSIARNIMTEIQVAIDLLNEGFATGIPEKLKSAASLFALCYEEFQLLYFSLAEVKAPKCFRSMFTALGEMYLTPAGEVCKFLVDLKSEYANALKRLRQNPRKRQEVHYRLVLTLGSDEKFSNELKKIEKMLPNMF